MRGSIVLLCAAAVAFRGPTNGRTRAPAARQPTAKPLRSPSLRVPLSRAAADEVDGVRRGLESVCCIFATCVAPDYTQPWSMYAEEDVTGSGFFVDTAGGPRVLTNEHVIKYARDVRIRPHGSSKRLKCRVVYASAERDLALLEVLRDDARKWQPPPPLTFAEALPDLYASVAVVGYPFGGDNVCVTRGVVSRLDAMAYGGGGRGEKLLVVQIDAAVNSGTSGGPALDADGAVTGVAFCGYAGTADNIGYIVPASVARNFLADAGDRPFEDDPGLNALGVAAQQTTNDALRRLLRMGEDESGILITRVSAGAAADGVLAPGDVLTTVAGHSVADDGTIALRANERVDVIHAVTERRAGETIEVEYLRGGMLRTSPVLMTPPTRIMQVHSRWNERPRFLIIGGLVLMPLSLPLIDSINGAEEEDIIDSPGVEGEHYGPPPPEGPGRRDIVVWASTLTSDANYGYADLAMNLPRLVAVNGEEPAGLAHAAELLRDAHRMEPFYDLFFCDPGASDPFRVALDVDQVDVTDEDLLERYNIPDLCSPDLVDHYYSPEVSAPAPKPRRRKKKQKKR